MELVLFCVLCVKQFHVCVWAMEATAEMFVLPEFLVGAFAFLFEGCCATAAPDRTLASVGEQLPAGCSQAETVSLLKPPRSGRFASETGASRF